MTDELDALRAALKPAPAADPAAKSAAIALAMKNFDATQHAGQGSGTEMRPNQDRPFKAGFLNGVHHMLRSLTHRRWLAATTSLAAVAVGVIVILPQDKTPSGRPALLRNEAPAARTKMDQTAEISDGATAPQIAADAPIPEGVAAAITEAQPTVPMAKMAAPARRAMATDAVSGLAPPEPAPMVVANTEAFATATPNPVKITVEEPVSTFSIDVDTASYAIVRNSLMYGALPQPESVRIEEMVNYFPFAYPAPGPGEAPFQSTVTVMQTPWNAGTRLVHIGLQGRQPALEDRPPLNLVFLVDTSGSMNEPNKLPLLKQSFRLLLSQLRPEDEVAIVAYAGSAGEVLAPTRAAESTTILAALDRLDAGGATAGAEGLALAYQVAARMAGPNEVSRVLLATDGDFNVGIDDPAELEAYITKQRDTGIYLSVLGFGRGNLDDATLQALAQNGNGQAAYIDTAQEARKALVDQLSGALFPIANDVKIQIEWNPALVAEYRLIGYETRILAREDFNNDKVDAGEIGAGHTVTAIYEVTPPDSPALRNAPLRYGAASDASTANELGFLRLRYKAPGENVSALIETPIPQETAAASDDARFGVAIAGFGQLLSGAKYLGDWGWGQAIALAESTRGADPFGYRIEAVNLMRLAQSLSQ